MMGMMGGLRQHTSSGAHTFLRRRLITEPCNIVELCVPEIYLALAIASLVPGSAEAAGHTAAVIRGQQRGCGGRGHGHRRSRGWRGTVTHWPPTAWTQSSALSARRKIFHGGHPPNISEFKMKIRLKVPNCVQKVLRR